jgi:hypothetical protein
VADGFDVFSLADGTLLVKPHYRGKPLEPGMSPAGVLTRLALADWAAKRLTKRGQR